MNRTQYEAIHGSQIAKPCKLCQVREARMKAIRLKRHRDRKDLAIAMEAGRQSGKVIELFERDELTGWHMRLNRQGTRVAFTGRGA